MTPENESVLAMATPVWICPRNRCGSGVGTVIGATVYLFRTRYVISRTVGGGIDIGPWRAVEEGESDAALGRAIHIALAESRMPFDPPADARPATLVFLQRRVVADVGLRPGNRGRWLAVADPSCMIDWG
jgi:hypothetical protein